MRTSFLTARDGFETRPAWQVPEGVILNLAGWRGKVLISEPWSDWLWFFEIKGQHPNGDPFTTTIKLPINAPINYKETTDETSV